MSSQSPAKKVFSKKRIVHKIISPIFSFITKPKKIIVFDAYSSFHLEHFRNVLEIMSKDRNIEIVVLCQFDKALADNQWITQYESHENFPIYKKVSLFIATDFYRIPHWFDCPTVYFGHGIGAKLNYAGSERIHDYDYIFSASKHLYKIYLERRNADTTFEIGLPILEDRNNYSEQIYEYFDLDAKKPLVIYAPSWAVDITKISDVQAITEALNRNTDYNVIISPHPLLFFPDRCSGKEFFKTTDELQHVKINKPSSPFTSLDLVKVSNLVVSDVSSILFEAMALEKIVIVDGNKDFFEYCGASHIYEEIIKVCGIPDWYDVDDTTIGDALQLDVLAEARRIFIDTYICNRGKATDTFINKIYQLIS